MNIYFSGIGGVGIGPLAEIAADAGHHIQGSDAATTTMTEQLKKRGVAISTNQDGSFLNEIHSQQPIEWFVHTSGLPDNHPEILLAQKLGIKKITKRDELLIEIISEKNLKLIAIAGTHGKTTTTGMTVWTLKQLGIPISYSVGTTLSFGSSGHYNPDSEYFIYECDEYDRNFLQFHPYVSVIPSIDYDHSETYGTPDDYMEAFHQFIQQSSRSILWRSEANLLGELPNTVVLTENDTLKISLTGEHNRRNATLVAKLVELLELGMNDDTLNILGQFPGVDRRFEKLASNLYSDYGHHPVEIAATLQLAHEISQDIVLVYQPHQNMRQHELRHYYSDCFGLANEIYWLPTYLVREDPTLPILTPAELVQDITAKIPIHLADLDDELWQGIQQARDRGALVLFMGAGDIDDWVRAKLAV
ncbi:MAG: Mur ligase domain-containing protein [Candidatus Saccharimonadales bacterium]